MERICPICGKVFKDGRGFAVHVANCEKLKNVEKGTSPPPSRLEGEIAAPPLSATVEYRSPRVKGLRIVVSPTYYNQVETPTGTRVIPVKGKTAEFKDGVFRTSDPEIIKYLNQYSDARYPVVNMTEMRSQCSR